MKVAKFGGSSLASGKQLEKVYNIVLSDPERKVIVVSAPGKRYSDDIKVTDLLITIGEKSLAREDVDQELKAVVERYAQIAEELNLSTEIIDKIKENIMSLINGDQTNPTLYIEALKAAGEDNNAKLVAAFFNERGNEAHYVNPKEAGLFVTNEPGNAQVLPESYEKLYGLRDHSGILIVPGFFGYSKDGHVLTFSRS